MSTPNTDSKIIVALDFADANSTFALVEKLDPSLCKLKVGKELFTSSGPQLVEALVNKGFDVFLDLKFHDIPNTVSKACEAASKLGVWMLNVHASGGLAMMQAAREGIARSGHSPLLIAVTVLTSMDQATLNQLGVAGSLQEHVLRLATLTKQAGLHGVVCSAQEAEILKQVLGKDFYLVTPGIRPSANISSVNADDQSRVVSPSQAIINGSNYLVIGRPITQAADPMSVLNALQLELASV